MHCEKSKLLTNQAEHVFFLIFRMLQDVPHQSRRGYQEASTVYRKSSEESEISRDLQGAQVEFFVHVVENAPNLEILTIDRADYFGFGVDEEYER